MEKRRKFTREFKLEAVRLITSAHPRCGGVVDLGSRLPAAQLDEGFRRRSAARTWPR
jgi:hypothetical protein